MRYRESLLVVFDDLKAWCNAFTGAYAPCPELAFAGDAESLSIGDVLVWDSENGYNGVDKYAKVTLDDEGRLSAPDCIRVYKLAIREKGAWPE